MTEDFHVKYRPTSFDLVLGQDHVVKALETFKKKNNWPHAFLFVGLSGSGKTTLSRIVAKELNCDEANIIEIDAASHSGVDHVRELTKGLAYEGFGETSVRVIIVDECHSVTKAGWQAFLKSIEEPPPHVYFMFCTTEDGKVPDTIKTRCNTFTLKPVAVDTLIDLVEAVADLEGIVLPKDASALIARESFGSPRRALTYLSKTQGCTTYAEVASVLETIENEKDIIELCRLLTDKRNRLTWKKVVSLVKKLETNNPESIRILVSNYVAKVLVNTDREADAMRLLTILEAFSQPFNTSDKLAPMLLALGSIVFDVGD